MLLTPPWLLLWSIVVCPSWADRPQLEQNFASAGTAAPQLQVFIGVLVMIFANLSLAPRWFRGAVRRR